MSVNLLLEDTNKPWCDIYVNKMTASEIAGNYGSDSGIGTLTVTVVNGLTVASYLAPYKYTITNNLISLWLFSPTVTSNNVNIILDFQCPIQPDKNWVDQSDVIGHGLFSTGTATNNCELQLFPKDLSSKTIRASGFSQASGASGRINMQCIVELSPI